MALTSSDAFTYASCGSLDENSAAIYDETLRGYYDNIKVTSGWLSETIDRVKKSHDIFMKSRMWEFGKSLSSNEGRYVGRFEIGYLGDLPYQQQAIGMMRDIIMANPMMMELYEQGRVAGYDRLFNDLNSGIGRDNFFYNKVMDGYLHKDKEDKLTHTVYRNNRDSYTHYNTRERFGALKTWRASNQHISKGNDPSSIVNNKIRSVEEGLKFLEELNKPKE